jgi:hypothetical protein
MEADVVWKAAMKPRLPTPLGKRFAFPTAPTAPAAGKCSQENKRDSEAAFAELDVHNSCAQLRAECPQLRAECPQLRKLARSSGQCARSWGQGGRNCGGPRSARAQTSVSARAVSSRNSRRK